MNPFRPMKAKDKPSGLYRAQSWDNSCDYCAHQQEKSNYCTLRKVHIPKAEQTKCRDWMSQDAGIPEEMQT